jgi:hypothetical protein
MAPKVTSEIIFTSDGRILTLQELKDIFDICYAVMDVERAQVIDPNPSESNTRLDQSILTAESLARYYYQYYRGINLTKGAIFYLLFYIKHTIFRIERVPILSVSYDTIIKEMAMEVD